MIDPQIVALHDAIEEGRVQEALDLLASVPANARGVDGDSALHLACLYGHEQLVDLLLARGADVNAKDDSGSTPLHDASASGYESIVRTLLAKGAAVCVADEDGDLMDTTFSWTVDDAETDATSDAELTSTLADAFSAGQEVSCTATVDRLTVLRLPPTT